MGVECSSCLEPAKYCITAGCWSVYAFEGTLKPVVSCAGTLRVRPRLRPNQKARPATNAIPARTPITIPAIAPPLSPESSPLLGAWVGSDGGVTKALAVDAEEDVGEDVLVVELELEDALKEIAARSWFGGGA